MEQDNANVTEVREGLARIKTKGNVFYNPVQEFNRDLSISVLKVFAIQYRSEHLNVENNDQLETSVHYEDGITILEALSATGLRSIRYAKEIPGIKQIVANDISLKAVEDIKFNIVNNNVENLVVSSHSDATMLMYQYRGKDRNFDAIDLDPYGCPSIFLDSAVQALKEGGLLLVTATDMAILAGNSPETCYSKYGAISLRIKSCHEMAIRILLQCIESHANRYGRYIVPLLSLSADFYIRVFVRIYTSAKKCKQTLSKLAKVYHCTGCGSFQLQNLGVIKCNDNQGEQKYGLPVNSIGKKCEHCEHSLHIGGPIWKDPIHNHCFVQQVLKSAPKTLATYKRIEGVLSVIGEELLNTPLYYTLEMLCGTLHVETPKMMDIRSAILNCGYNVSFTHMNKTSIKTDAPTNVLWDIMRIWERQHPVNVKRLTANSPATNILNKQPVLDNVSFKYNPAANPESKKMGLSRFQQNPLPNWGPGIRSTAMVGDQKIAKSKRNQGKRKREVSEEGIDNMKQ